MPFASLIISAAFTLWSHQLPPVEIVSIPTQPPYKALYFTSYTVNTENGKQTISDFKKVGGNTIIFDIQDGNGRLSYESKVPFTEVLADPSKPAPGRPLKLEETVKDLHDAGMYVVARYVLFKNPYLVKQRPQWALKTATGEVYDARDGPVFMDPGNLELRGYLMAVTAELALAGVDEVQFDYVRFPDNGTLTNIPYEYTGKGTVPKDQLITSFVASAGWILHQLGADVGVDLFGIVVWEDVSWRIIGQNVPALSKYVDAIYPMPYPSHFGPGWGGHDNPADEPYFFVQETVKRFVEKSAPNKPDIRSWLQAFSLRVTDYGPQYITDQVKALNDIDLYGYAAWNARNDYEITIKGLAK